LDERKESAIVSLCLPRLLQVCYTVIRSVEQAVSLFPARKVVMKSIEINHGSKEYVIASIFLESPLYVILHRSESTSSTAMDPPFLSGVSNEHGLMQIDTETG